ncbi:hypothetical protein NHX12_017730 [Muraenolepis orangiensis]|uniref:Complement C3 n=1 Tax=Muraenolepis orangiensis TaxID=630683 RepID=A0A9Q0IWZ1_9TELE|nr:hypothetical protein NHX12_017730 [Muraenolepis orangiensis]
MFIVKVIMFLVEVIMFLVEVIMFLVEVIMFLVEVIMFLVEVIMFLVEVIMFLVEIIMFLEKVIMFLLEVMMFLVEVMMFLVEVMMLIVKVMMLLLKVITFLVEVIMFIVEVIMLLVEVIMFLVEVIMFLEKVIMFLVEVIMFLEKVIIFLLEVIIFLVEVIMFFTEVIMFLVKVIMFLMEVIIFLVEVLMRSFIPQLPSHLLKPEEHNNKFVNLMVDFKGYHQEERVLMVSFHKGYIFIQTDKPIYNPGDTGLALKQVFTHYVDGVLPEIFTLSDNANEGMWTVVAKFDHWPQNKFTAQFEVKKYVLPAFNVTLVPRSRYLSLDDTQLEVEVSARYLYGEPVQGTAYVVFGLQLDNQMRRLPAVKQVSNATVLTKSGSDLVEAVKTGIRVVNSPYIMTFTDIPKYFKPGLPFDFTVQLNYQDGSPAGDVLVKVDLVDAAVTVQPGQRSEQQARQEVTVLPYQPFNRLLQNFLSISPPSQASVENLRNMAAKLRVTQEMKPSFRVVAYYTLPWLHSEEVVSDSIWVDLDDGCVGGLRVGPVGGRYRDVLPASTFRFQVSGDPGAKVNLVAVDNAVYLLSKQTFTQRKMWGEVEKGDLGCTRGGGETGLTVFSDAGLLFSSSLGAKTSTRQVLKCPLSARRRRSAELLQRRAQLEAQYQDQDQLQRRCCRAGLRDIVMPYSCIRRSLYITEGWKCIQAFRHCCEVLRGQKVDGRQPTDPPPLTTSRPTITSDPMIIHHKEDALEFHVSFMVKSVMMVVEDFYESWLWIDIDLPETSDTKDGLASVTKTSAFPDSITEWSIMAISASQHTGFCVAEPYKVKAWKNFFVDLRVPQSVARYEQIQIRAVLHNYGARSLHVRVVLMVTEGICSVAFNDRHTQEVELAAGSSVVVPYTLVPLVVGRLPVQVMVVGHDMTGGDRVEKILRVVLEGVQKTLVRSFVLNPAAYGGSQNIHLGRVELESVVPNSIPQTYVNIRGYEKQLAYRKSDGSYPPYKKEGSSTWITAFVVKVFSMAYTLVGVDEQQVCDPLHYLRMQKEFQGFFWENNPVYSTTMMGGLHGGEAKTTLTAFVVIALAEAQEAGIHCSGESKRKLSRSRRPYTVAITAYALTLLGEDPTFNPIEQLLQAASEGRYWPDSEGHLFSLEATGYGLLALLKSGHLEEATGPFNWLNSQRRRGGGFGSTQALSQYLVQKPPKEDISLQVALKVPGRTDLNYHFDPQTSFVARSSRVPLELEFNVEAQGNGQGILEVVTFYNQLHQVVPCPHFELAVATEESSEKPPADVIKSYQITIRVRALGPRDVRMVVLDISLPSGFTPDHSDLETLSNSVDHYISHFQVVDNLSDRGSLIIHLFKVSHKDPEILIFRLQQNFKLGLIQPSSVTVYEYYNPDHRCTQIYTPPEDKEALTQICRNHVCRCTEGDCCVAKSDSETFPLKTRETQACDGLNYVYKVQLLSVNQSYYDKFEMKITQVLKLGLEPEVVSGVSRLFMSQGGCREHLGLQQGSHYFIIGPKQDVWQTDNSYIYMLGKKTWVEYWPSPAECSSNDALRAKCDGLEAAAADLSVIGCRE